METMEPKGNDLRTLSALNRAVTCEFIVQSATDHAVDWQGAFAWCLELAEAVEIGKARHRATGEPVTVWRTPKGEPYALATLINGQWVTPRAATYRGIPYWAHLLKAL